MANSATLRKFVIGLIALAVLGIAAYSVTPQVDRVSAQDGGTTATPPTTPVPDSNAALSGLTLAGSTDGTSYSAVTIGPAFAAGTGSYIAVVADTVTTVKVTPTASHAGATVRVGTGTDLSAVASGSASQAIGLSAGINVIKVEVTAQGGAIAKTYTVTVAATDAQLAGLVGRRGVAGQTAASDDCNGEVTRKDVIDAINKYFDEGPDAPTRDEVIQLINCYFDQPPRPSPSIVISGLATSMEVGGIDTFRVTASYLSSSSSYKIIVEAGSGLAFDSACTDRDYNYTVPSGSESATFDRDLHACSAGSHEVGAEIMEGTTVVDEDSKTVAVTVTVTRTRVNRAPVGKPIGDRTLAPGVAGLQIGLSSYFSDPDRDTLSYSAVSNPAGIVTTTVRGGMLTLGRVSAGSTTITVTASDAKRLTASQSFTVTVEPNAPARVTGLTGTPGSIRGTVDLDWDPAARADGYEVAQWRQRPLLPGVYHWVLLDSSEVTIDTANTSAVVRGLTGGQTYRHRVRGIRGTGASKVEGGWSDHVDTTLTLPAKVTGLTGAPGTNSREINLDWDAANHASGYQVRQREHHNFPRLDNWTVLPTVFTSTSALVSNLDPDKTYVYQVRGTNVHGEGEWSDVTSEIAVRPDIPQGLKTQYMIGHRGVFLQWKEAAGAAGYEIKIARSGRSHTADVSDEWVDVTGLIPRTPYSFRVRAWHTNGNARLYSDWSAAVDEVAPEPAHWWGHQADHRVKYVKGSIANNLIEDRIAPAASAWNSEMASLGRGLEICTGAGCINPDGFTVTIKTVDNKNNAIGKASDDPNEGCGASRACVKPVGRGGHNASAAPGVHMQNMFMVFEDPPWFAQAFKRGMSTVWVRTEYMWTDDEDLNGQMVVGSGSPGVFYVYVDRIMLHEYGHTLGLPDFYDDKTGLMTYPHAVMDTGLEIHEEDINQLRAIYFTHNPH